MAPYILGIAIASMASGQLLSRSESISYRTVCATGAALITIGSGSMFLWNEHTGRAIQILSMIASGIGVGSRVLRMGFIIFFFSTSFFY